MAQIGIDERKNGFCRQCLTFQSATELVFQQIGEAESAGYGEKNGQNGDDGQQGVVSKGRCFVYNSSFTGSFIPLAKLIKHKSVVVICSFSFLQEREKAIVISNQSVFDVYAIRLIRCMLRIRSQQE